MSYDKAMKWQKSHPKGTRQPCLFHTNSGFWPSGGFLQKDYWPYLEECKRLGVEPMECEAFYYASMKGERPTPMKTVTKAVTPEVLDILKRCRTEGNVLFLPEQLSRPQYEAINKYLELMGGKWNRKAKGHVFRQDPATLLCSTLDTGKVVDEQQTYQFFFTPRPVVEQMIELAEIEEGMTILEPEAGEGHIVDVLAEMFPLNRLDVCEINPRCMEILRQKKRYAYFIGLDILEVKADKLSSWPPLYDRIIMNPPFSGGQDMKHIRHCYDSLLAPGGRLVSIVSESPFFHTNGGAPEFRDWLDDMDATTEKLPADAFKASGTGVNSRIVVLDKPRPSEPIEAPADLKPPSLKAFNLISATMARLAESGSDRRVQPEEIRDTLAAVAGESGVDSATQTEAQQWMLRFYLSATKQANVAA